MATIYGQEVSATVGSLVNPDGWKFATRLMASDWSESEFRLPSVSIPDWSSAVNIVVTGRTWTRRSGGLWVRVRIEFVGDGEPSTVHGGWMRQDLL